MGLTFAWDPLKETSNRSKHKASFEAREVFGDLLSITTPDPDHGETEERFVASVAVVRAELSWWSTWTEVISSGPSVPAVRRVGRFGPSKRADAHAEMMRAEYDFSKGVRGKYARRFAEGTNVVVLDPDVALVFPDSKSVNEALRALAKVAERHAGRRPRGRAAGKSSRK